MFVVGTNKYALCLFMFLMTMLAELRIRNESGTLGRKLKKARVEAQLIKEDFFKHFDA